MAINNYACFPSWDTENYSPLTEGEILTFDEVKFAVEAMRETPRDGVFYIRFLNRLVEHLLHNFCLKEDISITVDATEYEFKLVKEEGNSLYFSAPPLLDGPLPKDKGARRVVKGVRPALMGIAAAFGRKRFPKGRDPFKVFSFWSDYSQCGAPGSDRKTLRLASPLLL